MYDMENMGNIITAKLHSISIVIVCMWAPWRLQLTKMQWEYHLAEPSESF